MHFSYHQWRKVRNSDRLEFPRDRFSAMKAWSQCHRFILILNLTEHEIYPVPEVMKRLTCTTELSTKFQLLIKTKISTNEEVSRFKSLRGCIYHANKC